MMHGHEKSDLAIVAMKPANKARAQDLRGDAAEPVERRAGTKGNAGQQSTHRTLSQASVSQALERIRQRRLPSHTRGGSRMRESRTYGSVRGARDETRVPTATAAGYHRWTWSVAACPAAVRGQQAVLPMIAVLLSSQSPDAAAAFIAAFKRGLAEVGYVDGQNVTIEYRWAEDHWIDCRDLRPILLPSLSSHYRDWRSS